MVFLTFKDSIVRLINLETSCLIFFPRKSFSTDLTFFQDKQRVFKFYLKFECSTEKKTPKFLKCALYLS